MVFLSAVQISLISSATAFDPEGDSIAIRFCWGDGDTSEWSQFVSAGESIRMSHSWIASGNYLVKALAMDKKVRVTAWSNPLYLTIVSEGTLKWRYKTQGGIWASPAIGSDDAVYIVSDDGHLYAI